MSACAAREGASFRAVAGRVARDRVLELIGRGNRVQLSRRPFRRELAAWIRPNTSPADDGIPGRALGMGSFRSRMAPWLIRTFDVGRRQAAAQRELALRSALIAVLGTQGDDPRAWLSAGAAMMRVLLHASCAGVSASFLSEPIEVPELRARLGEVMGLGGYPQLLLRFGYGPPVPPTPRREIADVLTA
jgi:hypothetical protein